jgi:hypothetical protein
MKLKKAQDIIKVVYTGILRYMLILWCHIGLHNTRILKFIKLNKEDLSIFLYKIRNGVQVSGPGACPYHHTAFNDKLCINVVYMTMYQYRGHNNMYRRYMCKL